MGLGACKPGSSSSGKVVGDASINPCHAHHNLIPQDYTSTVKAALQIHAALAETTSILEQIKTHNVTLPATLEAKEAEEAKEMVKESWSSEQSLAWVNNTIQQSKVACSRMAWSKWDSVKSRIPPNVRPDVSHFLAAKLQEAGLPARETLDSI